MPAVGLTLPVDESVVVMLRLPVSVTPLYELTKKLSAAYGEGLVVRTDTGIDGWLAIALPEPTDSGIADS